MVKRLIRKRDWVDNHGVSEVIGTILILLMTVMLFSGIILWVWGMPTPEPVSHIDISTEFNPIDFDSDDPPTWDVVYVNLTHKGGDELLGTQIEFYLNVNNTIEVLQVNGISGSGAPYSLSGSDSNWNIGETWNYKNYSFEYYHSIKITLVDTHQNVVLWDKNLWGYEGDYRPLYVDKWTDGNPPPNGTTTRDFVQDNMTDTTGDQIPFGIFSKITDLDGDLNSDSVYVNFTFGPLAGNQYKMTDNGSYLFCDVRSGDGTFSVCDDAFWPGSDWRDWDGGILILNATDDDGHETFTRLTLHVYDFGNQITYYGNETGTDPVIEFAIAEPNSIDPNEDADFEVRAFVWDPQGNDNIDKPEVKVNLSTIGGGTEVMTEIPANSGVFRYLNAVTPDTRGEYNLTVMAKDLDGNLAENYSLVLHVILDSTSNDSENGSIPKKIWDYIGPHQIDLDDIFWTHGGEGTSPSHYSPIYRISKSHTESDGNMIWHIIVNNHGNQTFFPDKWTSLWLTIQGSDKYFYLLQNDTSAYSGGSGIGDFWYDGDYVLDINPDNQEQGGTQLDYKFSPDVAGGSSFTSIGVGDATAYMFIGLTGISGPELKTMQNISDQYCSGGTVQMSCYDPADYLYDGTEWETEYAGSMVPFLSFYVFSSGTGPSLTWPPPQPAWYT